MTTFGVVVVAYGNGEEILPVLDALAEQAGEGDRVVVVDNHPSGSTAALAETHPLGPRVVRAGHNPGFAEGVAIGVRQVTGDTLLLLNPDCVPEPGFLDAMRRPPEGWDAWMGLVALADGLTVNTTGGRSHYLGISWAGGVGDPVDAVPRVPHAVGFLSGACLAIRREAWDALGGFAPGFFMYMEDVELSHRLRLAGRPFGIVPDARVRHDYAFDKGLRKWELLERNRWLCVLRTYPRRLLVLVIPALILLEPLLLVMAVRDGWGRAKLRAMAGVLAALPRTVRERRDVQRAARVSPRRFADGLCADLDSPFMGGLARSRPVGALLGLYWAVVRACLGRRTESISER